MEEKTVETLAGGELTRLQREVKELDTGVDSLGQLNRALGQQGHHPKNKERVFGELRKGI